MGGGRIRDEFFNYKNKTMKKTLFLLLIAVIAACSSPETKKETTNTAGFINDEAITSAIDSINKSQPGVNLTLLEKGVKHAASLWREEDGTPEEFLAFTKANYISDPSSRKAVFNKISSYFESIGGNFNEMTLDLTEEP